MRNKKYKAQKERNPEGTVIEELAGTRFRVQMDDGKELICYLAGRMRVRQINVHTGDRVQVKVDLAGGKATNRIVWRN